MIKRFWNNIAYDKKKHFYGGLFIGFMVLTLLNAYVLKNILFLFVLTALISLAIGYTYEYYQKLFNKGTFEDADAFFVMYGSIVMSIILLTLKTIGLWKLNY